MSRAWRMAMTGLSLLVALLAAVAAALGVFARGDGAFVTVTSVRGEVYDMATTGVYAWNAKQIVAEGVGWDAFTLLVAAPALALTAWWVARGSYRARLVALGLFGYFVYAYLEYAVTWAFGPLFLLFVAIFGSSVMGIVFVSTSLAMEGRPQATWKGFPNRGWLVLSFVMSGLLATLWLRRIAAALGGEPTGGELNGETTMVVQALDLGLVIPALILSGVVAWSPGYVGRLFATVLSVTFVAMSVAIASMLISAGIVHGSFEIAPLAIFALAAASAGYLSVRMFLTLGPLGAGVLPTHGFGRRAPAQGGWAAAHTQSR
jgi:hypothetical protein